MERNAKGRLYQEGGSHGWLPLGAGRVETEEQIEQRELARAIALSVAEDAARKSMVEQMSAYINGTSTASAPPPLSIAPIPPPLPPRSLPPSRPVPALPVVSTTPPQPLSSTPSALRQKSQLSVVIPPSTTISSQSNGSPTERPSLTPATSYCSYFSAEAGSEEDEEGTISRRASTGTFGEYTTATTPGSSERSQDVTSKVGGSSASESRGSQSTDSHSNVSHDQFYSPIEIDSTTHLDSAPTDQTPRHEHFYTNQSAGRSMSSISERTEPSSLPLPLPLDSTPTASLAGSTDGSNESRGSLEPVTPIQRQGSPNWYSRHPAPQQDLEIQEIPDSRFSEERNDGEEEFEVGVRFGFPAKCVDAHHSCLEDGLGRSGAFPSEVVLSLVDEAGTFSVEARTWNELLRFLLWCVFPSFLSTTADVWDDRYGDTEVRASPEDVKLERSRHCDASLTLDYRRDDEETGVVRLNIHLLPSNQSNVLSDLTLLIPPPAKGKPISQQMSIQTFQLADNCVLPLRLSSIAVSLYTLRHLSGIYNTFESNNHLLNSHATAYRALAIAIKRLSDEHHPPIESNPADRSNERLVRRLRDRLRFWRTKEGKVVVGSPAPSRATREGRAKLIKPPPPSKRTRNVDRDIRVLTAENERESEYCETANGTEHELRYLPRLSAGN